MILLALCAFASKILQAGRSGAASSAPGGAVALEPASGPGEAVQGLGQ